MTSEVYLAEDGLSDFLLQQTVKPLHLRGHAGWSVHVGSRRMEEAPLLLCHLRNTHLKRKEEKVQGQKFDTVQQRVQQEEEREEWAWP